MLLTMPMPRAGSRVKTMACWTSWFHSFSGVRARLYPRSSGDDRRLSLRTTRAAGTGSARFPSVLATRGFGERPRTQGHVDERAAEFSAGALLCFAPRRFRLRECVVERTTSRMPFAAMRFISFIAEAPRPRGAMSLEEKFMNVWVSCEPCPAKRPAAAEKSLFLSQRTYRASYDAQLRKNRGCRLNASSAARRVRPAFLRFASVNLFVSSVART